MQQYILRRTLLNLFVIFLVISGVFLALRLAPGDVVISRLAQQTQIEDFEAAKKVIKQDLGLDKPLYQQYGEYLGGLITQLDLKDSFQSKKPVSHELKDRVGPTIELGILQIIVALLVATPIGIISAIRQDTWMDYFLRFFAIAFLGIPVFVLAVLVILGTSRFLGGTPLPDWLTPHSTWVDFFDNPIENLKRVLGPAVIGGLGTGAIIMRFLRSQMLEVLRQDYVRTAWAKGLKERVVVIRHALKNALIPVLTVVGLLLGTVVSGNVILEVIFRVPGIGFFAVNAIAQSDFPVVQGVVLLVAVTLVFVNLLVDIAYAWLDPRIRYG
ncbi:MAG: ABC transporter permease [Chloroflexi bacterium]|nr:ABC transporter permease [Chloroflexota bacterium]